MRFASNSISIRLRKAVLTVSLLALASLTAALLCFPTSSEAKRETQQRLSSPGSNSREIQKSYGKVPISFEPNKGQTDKRVLFNAHGRGYALFLTNSEAVITLRRNSASSMDETSSQRPASRDVVRMKLRNARKASLIEGLDQLPGTANYFVGNDPKKWQTNIQTFARVRYQNVYPGIDLVYHGNQDQLEYDFVVAAGVSPERIALTFDGTQLPRIDAEGNLLLKTRDAELKQTRPIAYQVINGQRTDVNASYRLLGRKIKFVVDNYDKKVPLVIDPVLIYSTFLGGSFGDLGSGIAVDSQGNAYLTGITDSTDFPLVSALQSTVDDAGDAFVTKLNAAGNALVYSTYLGANGTDSGNAIAIDSQGSAYVVGTTGSGSFPRTVGTIQSSKDGSIDAFISKLSASGSSLVYSTFLGGNYSDSALDVAVDNAGNAFVVGTTDSTQALVFPPLAFARHGSSASKSLDSAAHWTPSAVGLTANITTAFAQDPINGSIVYAGTNRGVFKSTDAGAHWQMSNTSPAPLTGNVIAIDPANPSVVYVAANNGVFKSTDGGTTYTQKNNGLFNLTIQALAIDPVTPSTLYLGTVVGIFKSTNGGDSWLEITNGIPFTSPRVNKIVIDPSNPATIYIGTGQGLFKTTNAGGLWTTINGGTPDLTNAFVSGLVIDPLAPSTLYASTFTGSVTNILFKTVDGGATWTASDSGLSVNTTTGTLKAVPVALAIDPTTPSTLYAATNLGGMYKTIDGGATWSQSNTGITNINATAVVVDRTTPANLYAGFNVGSDAFLVEMDPTAANVLYSATIGGDENDGGRGVALDSNGVPYVVGTTSSPNFPLVNALDSTLGGFTDVFVAKLNIPSGFFYSTFLGGNGSETGASIAVLNENAFVVGTTSSSDFPLSNPVKSTLPQFDTDAFVSKFNTSGTSLDFSTYLGGSGVDQALSVAVDSSGVFVTGATNSSDYPVVAAPQPSRGGSNDAFVTKLNANGSGLLFSTFLGGSSSDSGNGIAVDGNGNAFVIGTTSSNNFPIANALQPNLKGTDAFVTKIGSSMNLSLVMSDSPDPVALGSNLTYSVTVSNIGELTATGVLLTDPLPVGSTFVSATAGQGSCSGTTTVTCNLGTLNAGAQTTVTIVIKPPASTNISNTATVAANENDPVQTNNSATQTTQVSFADLSVTVATAYDKVAPGGKINYLFKVTNLSGSAATTISLADTLPSSTTFVSCVASPGTCGGSGNARTVTIPTLAVGESSSIVIVASVNQAVADNTLITNSATVESVTPDPSQQNNATSVNVTVTATPLRSKTNGLITLTIDGQAFTQKPDASELPIAFPNFQGEMSFPRWSPDGSKIAFLLTKFGNNGPFLALDVMNSDGTQRITITDNLAPAFPRAARFSWSPNSDRIAYVGTDEFVYVAAIDGSGSIKLPGVPTGITDIDWSADGSRFAFSKNGEIFTIDIDGTNLTKIVSSKITATTTLTYRQPNWSPDMLRIIVVESRGNDPGDLVIVNSDGTGERRLFNIFSGFSPSWSPDGKKVSFIEGTEIHVINVDGTNELVLPRGNINANIFANTWQPIPTANPLIPDGLPAPGLKLSGKVTLADQTASGGFLKLSGTRAATIAGDGSGDYRFVNLPQGGSYTITPTNLFGTFTPASRTITNLQADQTGFDFVFTPRNHTVNGLATDTSGNPLTNRLVSLLRFGSRRDTSTDQQGNYVFTNVFPGDGYILQAHCCDGGFTVLPPFFGQYTVNLVGDPSNSSRTIAGHINDATNSGGGMPGLTVTLDGGKKTTVKTTANGDFSFANLPVGLSYTVTPSTADGFTFNTPQLTFNNLTNDQFVGFLATTAKPVVTFPSLSKTVGEEDNSVELTVNRSGNTATAGSVDYETADATASERTDYNAAFGTLHFAPGETSKSFKVLITDDALIDGDRSFNVTLTNGSLVSVPFNTKTTVIIVDNDVTEPATNPLNDTRRFVRQQYADFLNREADPSGFDFWTNEIESCGANAQCREVKRINVSAAFFLSIEFQDTGFLVYRMHDVAYGTGQALKMKPFLHDTIEIGRDVIVGQPGWEQKLAANKQAFAKEFGLTEQFSVFYPASMSNSQFVNMLNANAGGVISASERDAFVSSLNSNTITRGEVVKSIAENVTYRDAQSNKAFVLMQYFGYMRRAPNDAPDGNFDGWQFWLNKLNDFNGNFVEAEMVKAFISSTEYLHRFGK